VPDFRSQGRWTSHFRSTSFFSVGYRRRHSYDESTGLRPVRTHVGWHVAVLFVRTACDKIRPADARPSCPPDYKHGLARTRGCCRFCRSDLSGYSLNESLMDGTDEEHFSNGASAWAAARTEEREDVPMFNAFGRGGWREVL